MHRTTVMLETELYRAVKRKAIDAGQPMRQLVTQALQAYLGIKPPLAGALRPKFGLYRARVRGGLGREELYGAHLTRQVR